MTEKEKIEQLTEALLRYVAVCGKTQLRADGLYTTAELMSRFGIVALPENAVVLTGEEWEALHNDFAKALREILQKIKSLFNEKEWYTVVLNEKAYKVIDELAKQYDVEVE